MINSYTFTESNTFTETHAKHIAMKVATDLKRIQRFYGKPSDSFIIEHSVEIIMLLKAGFLKRIIYGFQQYGEWIEPTLRYTASDLNNIYENDDDPGKITPGKNISEARFTSFLEHSDSWFELSLDKQTEFEKKLPFQRSFGTEPQVNGYLVRDLTYSAGGRAVYRESLRSF